MLATLDAGEEFAALETPLRDMRETIATSPEAESEVPVYDLSRRFGDVEGADEVKAQLRNARRALKDKEPDRAKALEFYDKAVAAYEAQATWRAEAAPLRPAVANYLDSIRGTLGIREQQRFTRQQALYMASCTASHRDISLNF